MGGGRWDDSLYEAEKSYRKSTNTPTFAYSSATTAKPTSEWKPSKTLDPAAIKGVRESRDSDEHPESRAVVVLFDDTGSMHDIPRVMVEKLDKLLGVIIAKGGVEHPQICVGAISDATCDPIGFQVGQFESDNKIDAQLRDLVLQGGGGGQKTESYELGIYFLARKTSIDCWEKRGEKGYAFLIGDEMPYPEVKKGEVDKTFGDPLQTNLLTEDVMREAQERYEVFFILPTNASHGRDKQVEERWRNLVGQNLIKLDDAKLVCETIAAAIAACEGTDVSTAADALGLSGRAKESVSKALATVTGRVPAKRATVDGNLPATTGGGVERL